MTTTKCENCMEEINMPITPVNLESYLPFPFFREEPGYKYLSWKESHLRLNIVICQSTSLFVAVICGHVKILNQLQVKEIYFV